MDYEVIFRAEQAVYVEAETEEEAIDKAHEILDLCNFEIIDVYACEV